MALSKLTNLELRGKMMEFYVDDAELARTNCDTFYVKILGFTM